MRLKPILAAVAVLVVLALIVRQVSQAVNHTFTPPANLAQVSRTSPRTQNGLTLIEIDHVSPDISYAYTERGLHSLGGMSVVEYDIGLWVKMPPDFVLPPNCDDSADIGCGQILSAVAHTSNGLQIPLRWRTPDEHEINDSTMLLIDIPAGYPDTVRWADVTLDDKRGDTATWRITHLPPMQHVLAPPVTPQTTFHQGNIQIAASAYRGPAPYSPAAPLGIHYDMKGTIPGAAHQWELGHLTETLEWEPPGYVPQDSGTTMGTGKVGSTVNIQMDDQKLFYDRSYPYLADTHWARLSAKLQEFETYDERVTFHNVSVFKTKGGGQYIVGSGPQTVTSPSGIPVTLDDVQHRPNFNDQLVGNGYIVHLLYPQSMCFPSLPHSPFWRKYKSPITVSADIPKPYTSMSSTSGTNEGTYMFGVNGYGINGPLPKVMANFPVIIRQRVDLRSVPMTFTLPVLAKRRR